MDETALDELILDDGQKLLYVFDYLTDRCFFIEMTKAITGRKLRDPLCTLSMGTPPPEMVDLDEFDAKIDAKTAVTDLDEDFYGSEEYSDDEFEAGNFDEISFDD